MSAGWTPEVVSEPWVLMHRALGFFGRKQRSAQVARRACAEQYNRINGKVIVRKSPRQASYLMGSYSDSSKDLRIGRTGNTIASQHR